MLQAPAYEEDGETIGMTTNSDVSSHPPRIWQNSSIKCINPSLRKIIQKRTQVKTYKSVEEVKGKPQGPDSLRRNGSGKKVCAY